MARHHQELDQQQKKMKKEELVQLRKIASSIAKEVKHFWESIQKVRLQYVLYMYTVLFVCMVSCKCELF